MHFFCLNQEICFFLCKCFDGLERGVAATETKPASDSLESSLQTFKSWELTFSPPLEEPLTESKLNDVFKLWLISVSELLCKHFLLINQTSSGRSASTEWTTPAARPWLRDSSSCCRVFPAVRAAAVLHSAQNVDSYVLYFPKQQQQRCVVFTLSPPGTSLSTPSASCSLETWGRGWK